MFIWIVRYAEIFLKGKNRFMFEKCLIRNIKDCLNKNMAKFDRIMLVQNRILIYSDFDCSCIKNVFGIASFSKAVEIAQELSKIKDAALKMYKKGSFRITASRLEKNFKYNSQEINEIVGAHIVMKNDAKVDLKNPGTTIYIELLNKSAYVFDNKLNGLGGLPAGVEGSICVLIEDRYSMVAAMLMMKRGCSITLLEKKKLDYGALKRFCYGFDLKTVKSVPKHAKAIAVNDMLDSIKDRRFRIPVFRPLIGYEKEIIEKWLRYA